MHGVSRLCSLRGTRQLAWLFSPTSSLFSAAAGRPRSRDDQHGSSSAVPQPGVHKGQEAEQARPKQLPGGGVGQQPRHLTNVSRAWPPQVLSQRSGCIQAKTTASADCAASDGRRRGGGSAAAAARTRVGTTSCAVTTAPPPHRKTADEGDTPPSIIRNTFFLLVASSTVRCCVMTPPRCCWRRRRPEDKRPLLLSLSGNRPPPPILQTQIAAADRPLRTKSSTGYPKTSPIVYTDRRRRSPPLAALGPP